MEMEFNYQDRNGHWFEVNYLHNQCDYDAEEIDEDSLTVYNEIGFQVTEEDSPKTIQEIKNYLFTKIFFEEEIA